MRCIQLFDSSAEFLLHDLLGKARVVHRHVHALLLPLLCLPFLLLLLLPLFLGPLRGLAPCPFCVLLRLLCEDDAQVEPLVYKRCLDVGQGLLYLISFSSLVLSEELAHEEFELEDLLRLGHFLSVRLGPWFVLCLGQSEALRHHVEQELEGAGIDGNVGLSESVDELGHLEVAIAFCISRGKGLLQGDSSVRERQGPDVVEDLGGPAQVGSFEELDLFCVDLLH